MRNFLLRQVGLTLLTSTALVIPSSMAAEYEVSTPTTVQNGDVLHVIDGNDTLVVNNTGSISTSGTAAIKINGSNNAITNAGALNVSGIGNGIWIDDSGNSIVNSGTINTDSSSAVRVTANDNTILNSGTITTLGNNSEGIYVNGDGNTVTNTGTVLVTGLNATAIETENFPGINPNNVINSGRIISTQGQSLSLDSGTLNLTGPAFIGGAMQFNDPNITVNITTGPSQSVLWVFDPTQLAAAPTISGPGNWAYNAATGQFATFDPTALSAASDVLANSVGALSDLFRMNGASDYPVSQGEANNAWWLNGYGNFSNYSARGLFNSYESLGGGFAAGTSFVLNDDLSIGAMLGYQATHLAVNSAWTSSQTQNSDGVVGALSANWQTDNFFADFTLFGGAQSNTSSRFVNDNLATNGAGETLGIDYANGAYGSWFISPEIRFGADMELGQWTFTPSATARYSLQSIAAYTETGSNANATIGARQIQVLDGNLELAASRDIGVGSVGLRGGIQYRQTLGATTADITLLGQSLALPVNTSGALAGYIAADASFALGEMTSVDFSTKVSAGQNGAYTLAGSAGVKSHF